MGVGVLFAVAPTALSARAFVIGSEQRLPNIKL
jgi:hypothetical protein